MPGRPTSYEPRFCELVIEVGKRGGSVVEMAVECGCHKSSLYEWAENNEAFSDAFTHARQLSQVWWEQLGQQNMLVPPGVGTFSQSAWSRSMAARFPEDWRESKHTEVTGKDGGAVEQKWTVEFINAPSEDQ